MLTNATRFKFKFGLPYWLLISIAVLAPLDQYQRDVILGMSLQRTIFIFLLGLFLIVLLVENRRIYISPLAFPLLLYFMACLLGSYNADPGVGLRATMRTTGYILLFFVAANLPKSRRQILSVLIFLMVGLFCVEILAVFKMLTGKSIFGLNLIELKQSTEFEQITRMKATSENPNEFGTLLVFSLPILPSLFFAYGKKYRKYFFLMFFVVGLVCLFALQSRSALLGVSIALMVMAFYFIKKKAGRKSIFFLLLFSLLTVLGFTQIPQLKQMNVFARITDQRYYDLKENKRIKIWKESAKFIAVHPLGAGIGNSAQAIYEYSDEITRARSAHNVFLSTGTECGWLGVVSVVSLFTVIFYQLWAGIRRAELKCDRILLIGFLSSFIAFFVHNQFHSLLGWNIVWLILGLAFAALRMSKQSVYEAFHGVSR